MKTKKRKIGRFWAWAMLGAMVLNIFPAVPVVEAKVKYETRAFDKKFQSEDDFKQGKLEKLKIKKQGEGVELEAEAETGGVYITPEVKAPFGATHIGLHWSEDFADENLINAYVRTRGEGKEFGEWVEAMVETEDRPDEKKKQEIFASLVYAGEKEYAQARFEFGEKDGKKAKLKDFTFTFLNSGELAQKKVSEIKFAPKVGAESAWTTKVSTGGQAVDVISREQWGADESLRFKNGAEDWPRSFHGTRKLVIHHTAVKGSNGVTDLEKNKEAVRSIYYYHAYTQGWGDIGYNALVDGAGNVYEGRYGTHEGASRENPTAEQIMVPDVEAGHTAGYNQGSFGVAAMGDFTRFNVPTAQLEGLKKVLTYVADERGVNVQGNSDFRRYDGTWHLGLNNLIGHRDAVATACPGEKLYEKAQEIKNSVDSFLLHNLSGLSGTLNGLDIESKKVEMGILNFSWDTFADEDTQQVASNYQYLLERVYGKVGVASDSQAWETAWFYPGTITDKTSVQIDLSKLESNSNYVFYVRALDSLGKPLSTVKHINFETGEIFISEPPQPDETLPVISIVSPQEGETISGNVYIDTQATDNVGIEKVEFYINNSLIGEDNVAPYNFDWDTKTLSDGVATIAVKAYDLSGNQSGAGIGVVIDNPEPDTEDPTIPADLTAVNISENQINLTWSVSSDNVAVAGYNIYRNGVKVGDVSANDYQNSNLMPETVYSYAVSAFDQAGNESEKSNIVEVKTLISSNQAPVVDVLSPGVEAQVSGVVLISAKATDSDGSVENMKVYVDGVWMVTKDGGIMEYNFNTKKVSLGKHIIEVTAEDNQGKIGSAQTVIYRIK